MGHSNADKGTLYLGDTKIGEVQDIEFTTECEIDLLDFINTFNSGECEFELIDNNKVANKLEVNFNRAYEKGKINKVKYEKG